MKNQTTILITTLIFALVFCGAASASGGLDNVYVATDGNDSWDGSSPTPGPGNVGPVQSIETGLIMVNNNGIVNLAAGTYNKTEENHADINLTITNRIFTIQGAGTTSTVIDAMALSNIFNIATSTITIKDLTMKNGQDDFGGAIDCGGTLILENVLFENNHATLSGGAIRSRDSLYVDECQFIGNYAGSGLLGGAIFAQGDDVTIKNSQFTGNHAEQDGGAIWALVPLTIDNCIFNGNYVTDETGKGGAVYSIYNPINITKTTFTGNTAYQGGAIFIVGTDYLIKGNNFLNNQGSAIYIQMGATGSTPTPTYRNINFNRFYNNTEYALYLYTGNNPGNDAFIQDGAPIIDGAAYSDEIPLYFIDATNNWWGSNSNPKENPNNIGGDVDRVDADPWLTLTITSNPTNVAFGGTSTITASLNTNSNGEDVSSQGYIPDGTLITITTDIGNVGSKSVSVPTLAGIATATLRANEGYGLATLYAILDGFRTPLPANVVIAQAATTTVSVNTVGMQATGAPIAGIALAILMVMGGLISAKKR